MTSASIIPFVRVAVPQQAIETASSVSRTVSRISAGSRYGFYHGPVTAKVSLPKFVVICRYQAPKAAEGSADFCCSFSDFYHDRGFMAVIKDFCRSLTGWSLPRIHLRQKPTRGLSYALRSFRGFAALFHEQTMNRGAPHWNEKPFPNPTTALLRIR